MPESRNPRTRRARLPEGFGTSRNGRLLAWSHVEERMSRAKHYWLSTTGPDGAPHTRPLGGMWLEGALYCGGSPSSRWLRNVIAEPRVCINLSETGDQALVLHGRIEIKECERGLAENLVRVSNAKYGYGQRVEEYDGQPILVFRPSLVFAWNEIGEDATCFEL